MFSVIMPVWNGEKYLVEAIESILAQTFEDFEFLILDDGSKDGTPAILSNYEAQDLRVRVIRLTHEGIVSTLNRGIAEARGEWIARMDCDDVANPERLAKQMRALQEKPKAILCHTAIRQIGDPLYTTQLQRFPRTQAMIAARLCYQCPIVHSTVLFSKVAFLEAGGYKVEERHVEDYGLWGRMLPLGEFVGLNEPLLDFRVHGDSISKKKADTQRELTSGIALRHCQEFMGLTSVQAGQAHRALTEARRGKEFKEWFWFLGRCLLRMRWQSVELWGWAASQTCRRSVS